MTERSGHDRRKSDHEPPDVILPTQCPAHSGIVSDIHGVETGVSGKLSILIWVIGLGILFICGIGGYLSVQITKYGDVVEKQTAQLASLSQRIEDYNIRSNARLDKLEKWQSDVRNWIEISDRQQATREQVKTELNKPKVHWWTK